MGELLLSRSSPAWLATLGVVATLAGCGDARSVAPSSSVVDVVLRKGGYTADGAVLARAESTLIARCMASRGFRSTMPTAEPPPMPAPGLPRAGAGYGIHPTMAAAGRSDRLRAVQPPEDPAAALPARRRKAFARALEGTGPPRPLDVAGVEGATYRAGGCYGTALATLYGSVRAYFTDVARQNSVAAAVEQRVTADRPLTAATGRWLACMDQRGFRFATPSEPRLKLYRRYALAHDIEPLREQERRTAAADRGCGLETAMYVRQERALDAATAALTPEQRHWMQEVGRRRKAATAVAQEVLGRGGP